MAHDDRERTGSRNQKSRVDEDRDWGTSRGSEGGREPHWGRERERRDEGGSQWTGSAREDVTGDWRASDAYRGDRGRSDRGRSSIGRTDFAEGASHGERREAGRGVSWRGGSPSHGGSSEFREEYEPDRSQRMWEGGSDVEGQHFGSPSWSERDTGAYGYGDDGGRSSYGGSEYRGGTSFSGEYGPGLGGGSGRREGSGDWGRGSSGQRGGSQRSGNWNESYRGGQGSGYARGGSGYGDGGYSQGGSYRGGYSASGYDQGGGRRGDFERAELGGYGGYGPGGYGGASQRGSEHAVREHGGRGQSHPSQGGGYRSGNAGPNRDWQSSGSGASYGRSGPDYAWGGGREGASSRDEGFEDQWGTQGQFNWGGQQQRWPQHGPSQFGAERSPYGGHGQHYGRGYGQHYGGGFGQQYGWGEGFGSEGGAERHWNPRGWGRESDPQQSGWGHRGSSGPRSQPYDDDRPYEQSDIGFGASLGGYGQEFGQGHPQRSSVRRRGHAFGTSLHRSFGDVGGGMSATGAYGGLGNYGSSAIGSRAGGDRTFTGSETTDFRRRGPKGYKRSDESIREDVCEALAEAPQLDASEIEVHVENGEVRLTGTVDSRRAKRMAEDCIEDISGVDEVQNQLRVRKFWDRVLGDTGSNDPARMHAQPQRAPTASSSPNGGTSATSGSNAGASAAASPKSEKRS